ncbi:MAG: hypothetical protein IPN86_22280 [Saprospiraceae bacterium]|jgi:hypothetical protein|nr:hypothetical protein [Saprospiraceae bacterium]
MLQSIKKWFFSKEFKSDARPKGHQTSGLNSMQSVAILFDGTDETERKIVHKFKKSINPDGKKDIKSLAFINNQLPLDNIDYAAYNLKNIKWYGLPFGEKVEEFVHLKFDILIVIVSKMLPHYEYIIAHSDVKFVIGPSIFNAEKYFDLTVEISENESSDIVIKKIMKAIDKVALKK